VTRRYPPIEPYESGVLDVGDGHQLYWECCGNPEGTPALWLHGGPGSGSSAGSRRNFDPASYRVVLFDQRGCGRSRPLATEPGADLSTNTTAHLIEDIERLREHLGITRWVVAGVSWGVTLAIAYAQRHREAVRAMVLAAVTSADRREIDWTLSSLWCPNLNATATWPPRMRGCSQTPTGRSAMKPRGLGAHGKTLTSR